MDFSQLLKELKDVRSSSALNTVVIEFASELQTLKEAYGLLSEEESIMNDTEKRAIEYIKNTGGNPKVDWFDEDHEPIGKVLREQLIEANLIKIVDGRIELVP